MKKKSIISVIVPVYNVEKYIDKCLYSICNQTYSNLEIILVNDGSTDSSLEKCNQFANKDKRIKVVTQNNKGLSAARNTGIAQSKGEYLVFIDSDDYISNNMIEKLYSNLIKNKSDLCICDFEMVYGEEMINLNEDKIDNDSESIVYDKYEALLQLYGKKSDRFNVAWNKIYKRHIFDTLVFPEGKVHEDMYVMHRVFDKCDRISFINESLYYYVQRNDSITGQKFNLKALDILGAFEDRIKYFEELGEVRLKMITYIKYINQILMLHAKLIKFYSERKDISELLEKKYSILKLNIIENYAILKDTKLNKKEKLKFWIIANVPDKLVIRFIDKNVNVFIKE